MKEIEVHGWVGTISQVRKSINGLIKEKIEIESQFILKMKNWMTNDQHV